MEELQESLYEACKRGDRSEVIDLLSKGADVDKADENGETPLLLAFRKNFEIVELLLSVKGIDVNKADKDGKTPLMNACYFGHVDTVKKFLKVEGIDVNKADKDGKTPLMQACIEGHIDVARVLLAAEDIDINKKNRDGYTALDQVTLSEANHLFDLRDFEEESDNHDFVEMFDLTLRKYSVIEEMLRARGNSVSD